MIQSSRCDGSCLHPSTQYSPLLGCMSANIFSQSVWCFFTLFPWVCRNFSVLYNPIPLSSMFFFFFSGFTVLNLVFESLFLPDFYIWCMMRVKFHPSACSCSQRLLLKTLTFPHCMFLGPLLRNHFTVNVVVIPGLLVLTWWMMCPLLRQHYACFHANSFVTHFQIKECSDLRCFSSQESSRQWW